MHGMSSVHICCQKECMKRYTLKLYYTQVQDEGKKMWHQFSQPWLSSESVWGIFLKLLKPHLSNQNLRGVGAGGVSC